MSKITYDRSPNTCDFEMIDLPSCKGVSIEISPTGKLWVNLNGKCLLRVGKLDHFDFTDDRSKPHA